MATSKNLIIVPAFNEGQTLELLLRKTRQVRAADDVVVVDDGSTDATGEAARQAGVIVLRHPVNLGYGASLQTGILYALRNSYSTAVFLDGDGQHEPADIDRVLAPVSSGECDVVIGSRYLGSDAYRAGPLRWLGVKVFSLLVRILTSIRVTDPTSGSRALNRRAMRLYMTEGFPDEFPDANAIVRYHRAGLRVREVPVTMYASAKHRPMHRGSTVPYYLFNVVFSILIALLQSSGEQDDKED